MRAPPHADAGRPRHLRAIVIAAIIVAIGASPVGHGLAAGVRDVLVEGSVR